MLIDTVEGRGITTKHDLIYTVEGDEKHSLAPMRGIVRREMGAHANDSKKMYQIKLTNGSEYIVSRDSFDVDGDKSTQMFLHEHDRNPYDLSFSTFSVPTERNHYTRTMKRIADYVLDMVDHRAYIAGSYAVWMLLDYCDKVNGNSCVRDLLKRPSDMDLFLYDEQDLDAVRNALDNSGLVLENDGRYGVSVTYRITDDMIAGDMNDIFSDAKSSWEPLDYPLKINLILPNEDVGGLWGYPEDLMKNFDFSVCQAAYVPTVAGGFVLANSNIIHDLTHRRLELVNIRTPFRQLQRYFKYVDKGFKPSYVVLFEIMSFVRHMKDSEYDAFSQLLPYLTLSRVRMEKYDLMEPGSAFAKESELRDGSMKRDEIDDSVSTDVVHPSYEDTYNVLGLTGDERDEFVRLMYFEDND